jgi:uncharacterized membrane protein
VIRRLRLRREPDLSRPRGGISLGVHYDPDAFGRFSEAIARTLGTARYLVVQTGIVIVWIAINIVPWGHFDPAPFIGLTLALSLQASYAAPLILLAQNRQDDRDRAQSEFDRDVNARTQADTEFLARELASVRLSLADVVSAEDLADSVDRVTRALDRLGERLERLEAGMTGAQAFETGPASDE